MENITAITILVLFARRLFVLMRLCTTQNMDIEYRSSMISSDTNTLDIPNPAAQENQMNQQISLSTINVSNNNTTAPISTNTNNIDNSFVPMQQINDISQTNQEQINNNNNNNHGFNEDQIEYLHLITRLTVINAVSMISGQLVYFVYLMLYDQYGFTQHILFYVVLHNVIDLFVDLTCVYFACTFSLPYYHRVCCCCHYIIYRICLCCVKSAKNKNKEPEPKSLTVSSQ